MFRTVRDTPPPAHGAYGHRRILSTNTIDGYRLTRDSKKNDPTTRRVKRVRRANEAFRSRLVVTRFAVIAVTLRGQN